MRSLLKSLILHPTVKKYTAFRDYYYSLFKDRDKPYNELAELYIDAKLQFDIYLTFTAIKTELGEIQNTSLLGYVSELEQDAGIPVFAEDSEYVIQGKAVEKMLFEQDAFSAVARFQHGIKVNPVKDLLSIAQPVDQLILDLHKAKDKVLRNEASTCGLLYGADSVEHVEDIYDSIVEKKKLDNCIYYTFGYKKLESVKMTRGDLVIIGGFTSHGKSMFLRNFIYRLLVEYGLNCYYCSLEMSYEKMKLLFLALHANNKDIFPGGLDIPYEKIKEGMLSDEEKDFLFKTVAVDLFTSPDYGTLYLEYPNKSRYRLSDVKAKINELEVNMPVHVAAIDYITMLYPLETDKGVPERQDYNLMIKEFKNMALSHRKVDGTPSPFLALTPAQISRGGLNDAIKNGEYYDLSALREYSELESSADIVMTVMLTAAMREQKKITLQNLKNRDGRVETDKVEVNCELDKGFNMFEIGQQSREEYINLIKDMRLD